MKWYYYLALPIYWIGYWTTYFYTYHIKYREDKK